MATITAEILQQIVDSLGDDKAQEVAGALNPAMDWAEVNTPQREAAFIAQWAHETQGFSRLVENLNYSAQGLLQNFSTHFTPEEAQDYARQPERIANRAYADRMGNGDEDSGDGWRYRGRGYPQLTGKDNYTQASADTGYDFVNQPELVEQPGYAAYAGAWFWAKHGLNRLADIGDMIPSPKKLMAA